MKEYEERKAKMSEEQKVMDNTDVRLIYFFKLPLVWEKYELSIMKTPEIVEKENKEFRDAKTKYREFIKAGGF